MTLARLYQKGVPVKRLADTLERIVNEYYHLRHAGESFSEFWQRTLATLEPQVILPEQIPSWRCASCGYEHTGAAPPGFCPQCAGVRRQFALCNSMAGAL
jgi:rubrerythrin